MEHLSRRTGVYFETGFCLSKRQHTHGHNRKCWNLCTYRYHIRKKCNGHGAPRDEE